MLISRSTRDRNVTMKIIDDNRDYLGTQIANIIEGDPSVTVKNIRITSDLDISYETPVHDLRFEGVQFLGRVDIGGDKGDLSFCDVTFEKDVDLYLSRPSQLDFWACEFKSTANFHSIETTSFSLNKSRFRDHCVFVNMKVKELLNLADTLFEKSVDFSGAQIGEMNVTRLRSNDPIQIRWSQFGCTWISEFYSWALAPDGAERVSRLRQFESALEFWKRNFATLGQRRDELEANYEVMRLRRNYLTRKYGLRWWASILLELPSRYGTRPFRPIMLGVFMIFLFGFVYWFADPFQPVRSDALAKKPLFLFSLLYSLDSFVPVVNVSGVKEWGWVVANEYRWLVLIERVLGLTTSVLAAYSISQTFSISEE